MNYLQEVENAAWDVEKHFVLAIDVKMAKRLVELSYRKKRAYFHFIVPRFVSMSQIACAEEPHGNSASEENLSKSKSKLQSSRSLSLSQTVKQFWADVRMFDQSTVASFQIIDEIEFKNMKSMRGGVSTPKNPEDEHVNVSIGKFISAQSLYIFERTDERTLRESSNTI